MPGAIRRDRNGFSRIRLKPLRERSLSVKKSNYKLPEFDISSSYGGITAYTTAETLALIEQIDTTHCRRILQN